MKMIRDSNANFRINLDSDLDACRIVPKMYWIYFLVGICHFAKYRKIPPVTVWEMLTNLLKFPVPQR